MRTRPDIRQIVFFAFVVAAPCLLLPRTAAAEIPVADAGGWKLSIDGRFNLFVMYAYGDSLPRVAPEDMRSLPAGAGLDNTLDLQQTSAGTFRTVRLRNGYVPNVLSFNLTHDVSERTRITGHLALWSDIETNLQLYSDALAWMQEGYLKIEGAWGSVLAGRALALFSRGAVEIDFNYGHGYGLGYPCNLGGVHPTCGQIGFGELFPFFRSGLVYATPSLGGFMATGRNLRPGDSGREMGARHNAHGRVGARVHARDRQARDVQGLRNGALAGARRQLNAGRHQGGREQDQ